MQSMLSIKIPTIKEMPAIFQTSWVSYESWIRIWKSLVDGGELIDIIIDNIILHVQNSPMSWFYPGFHSPWSCFFIQCYPFPPVGPSLVKWSHAGSRGPPHSRHLPTRPQWLGAPLAHGHLYYPTWFIDTYTHLWAAPCTCSWRWPEWVLAGFQWTHTQKVG